MSKFDKLTDKLYQMFNSYEFDFKMYDINGKGTANPYVARYFYIREPNFMLIVDESNNNVEIHKAPIDMEQFKKIFKSVRNICQYHAVKLDIKNYNSKIKPKDYSHKIEKEKYIKDKEQSILETKFDSQTINSITLQENSTIVKLNYLNLVTKNPIDSAKISGIVKPLNIQTEKKIISVSGMTFEEACENLINTFNKKIKNDLQEKKSLDITETYSILETQLS